MKIGDPLARTPETPPSWKALSEGARKEAVRWALKVTPYVGPVDVLSATSEGRVTIRLRPGCAIKVSLLVLERHLRRWVSEGIELMLEPAVDTNKQRAFRGVQVL
uniref:Uncharacterized protein n=1 Tax=viral metagenome TaxID=1070528 RepID=A0A6M3L8V8_9ZZZZ